MKRSIQNTRRILQSSPSIRTSCRVLQQSLAAANLSSSAAEVLETEDEPIQVTQYSVESSTTAPLDLEKAETTALVDQLFQHTRQLMGNTTTHHTIAYSGGIDSSLVAALVHQSKLDHETVRAVLGLSPAVPDEQILLARSVARHIGVPLFQVPTAEGNDETYIQNAGQACLACKTHLYSTLQAIVHHHTENDNNNNSNSSSQHHQLYNGTNADDLKDPTRLGLIAAQQYKVQSPLEHLTKQQVRKAGRHLGLPNWNHAASPCLRSRLALGVQATKDHLARIERAERHVRQQLSDVLNETSNLRVRLLAKNQACIEVDEPVVERAKQENWSDYFIQKLGFASVRIRAFRSGSVATRSHQDS